MSTKIKMGRPKLPKGEAKTPFPMRFSAAELAAFEKKAKGVGMGLREWMTATLTEAAK